MSDNDHSAGKSSRQGDTLLWLAAAGVGLVGLAWLVMLQPWASDEAAVESADTNERRTEAAAEPAPSPSAAEAETELASDNDNPLRTARLALEAGMLVEPERHSAWSLYAGVLENDPDNEDALAGRARVAELLIERADTALEQGRIADARAVGERILGAIEGHSAATRLMERIEEATQPPPEPEREPAPEAQAQAEGGQAGPEADESEEAAETEDADEADEPDPAVVAFESALASFEEALNAGRLLTPADASARYFVNQMVAINAEDGRAQAARRQLFDEFLARSREALEAVDAAAARTWIDEAEKLGVDPDAVADARSRVVDMLAERESQRPVPVSSFEIREYVAPSYPNRARQRDIEGWVEIEFTVTRDGATRDISVVDSSEDSSVFDEETIAAVEQWEFEPREFMGRTIEQRAYTRIRFNLD